MARAEGSAAVSRHHAAAAVSLLIFFLSFSILSMIDSVYGLIPNTVSCSICKNDALWAESREEHFSQFLFYHISCHQLHIVTYYLRPLSGHDFWPPMA